MITTVYVEQDVLDHPRTRKILERVPKATIVRCQRYGEVFNRSQQSFRLQKRSPSLILARKTRGSGGLVLPAPENYGVGGARNFYFAHMLNCPYDCRYCFLQGMYRSAHQVLFVNYEEFFEEIVAVTKEDSGDAWFYSGYDCDSLAFEGVSGFVAEMMGFLERTRDPSAKQPFVELRTKSVLINTLLEREPLDNVVVAYSLSPSQVAVEVEHGAPSVERRIHALVRLQEHGWRVGLRFDPLLYRADFQENYRELFDQVFSAIDGSAVHSVSLGVFRLPRDFHRRLVRLYPTEKLLAMPFADNDGMVSYRDDLAKELFETVRDELLGYIAPDQYFPCLS